MGRIDLVTNVKLRTLQSPVDTVDGDQHFVVFGNRSIHFLELAHYLPSGGTIKRCLRKTLQRCSRRRSSRSGSIGARPSKAPSSPSAERRRSSTSAARAKPRLRSPN